MNKVGRASSSGRIELRLRARGRGGSEGLPSEGLRAGETTEGFGEDEDAERVGVCKADETKSCECREATVWGNAKLSRCEMRSSCARSRDSEDEAFSLELRGELLFVAAVPSKFSSRRR